MPVPPAAMVPMAVPPTETVLPTLVWLVSVTVVAGATEISHGGGPSKPFASAPRGTKAHFSGYYVTLAAQR